MVVIVHSNIGNVGSIKNMLKKIGVESVLSRETEVIEKADRLILPGIGAFDRGMQNLADLDLINLLNKKVLEDKTPVLGVCLGMQLMTKSSEEGKLQGLGWIDAETIKFPSDDKTLRVPHMGWNILNLKKEDNLFKKLPEDARFYFVHSYYIRCNNPEDIAATTNYGTEFVSSFQKDNIFGCQFHPEKSHRFGMEVYRNFMNCR